MIEFSWPGGLRDGILVTDGALSQDICTDVVSVLSEIIDDLGSQGQTIGGMNTTWKKSTDIRLVDETLSQIQDDAIRSVLENFVSSLQQAINICYSEYRRKLQALWHLNGAYDSGFQVQRYTKAIGHYREHVDSFPWHAPTASRALSLVVYLNDVDQGGETEFTLQEIKVKPVRGRICMFPSNFTHPHSGNPPLTSDKWMVSTFLHGTVDVPAPVTHGHDHVHHEQSVESHEEHYHLCVQCANRESHECKYDDHSH